MQINDGQHFNFLFMTTADSLKQFLCFLARRHASDPLSMFSVFMLL